MTLCHRTLVDAFRVRGRGINLPIEDFTDDLVTESGPDPTEATDMAKMIAMLDERSEKIVQMVGIQGASTAEAGQVLEMTEGAARVALLWAFKTLTVLRERHVT